jgi:outer membrane biosynthesis protein TonB
MATTKEMDKPSTKNQKIKEITDSEEESEIVTSPAKPKKTKEKKEKTKKPKKKKKSSSGLGLIKSDPTETLSGLGEGIIGGGHQQQQQGGGQQPLSLRLDLNLEVEITLKARVHG